MHQSKFLEAVSISEQTKKTTVFHLAKIGLHFESKTRGRFNSKSIVVFGFLARLFFHTVFVHFDTLQSFHSLMPDLFTFNVLKLD